MDGSCVEFWPSVWKTVFWGNITFNGLPFRKQINYFFCTNSVYKRETVGRNCLLYEYHVTEKQISTVVVDVDSIDKEATTRIGVEEGRKATLRTLKYKYYIWNEVLTRFNQLQDTANPSWYIHIAHIAELTVAMEFHQFDAETRTMSIAFLPDGNTSRTKRDSSVAIFAGRYVTKNKVSYDIVDGLHHRSVVTDLSKVPETKLDLKRD